MVYRGKTLVTDSDTDGSHQLLQRMEEILTSRDHELLCKLVITLCFQKKTDHIIELDDCSSWRLEVTILPILFLKILFIDTYLPPASCWTKRETHILIFLTASESNVKSTATSQQCYHQELSHLISSISCSLDFPSVVWWLLKFLAIFCFSINKKSIRSGNDTSLS